MTRQKWMVDLERSVKRSGNGRHYAFPLHKGSFEDSYWLRENLLGRYGSIGIAGFSSLSTAATRAPVASDVVIPRPSWPVASHIVSSSGDGPINGSLSGVAARKPVQTRIAFREAIDGMYSAARLSIALRIP